MTDNARIANTAGEQLNEANSEANTVADTPVDIAESKLDPRPEVTWDGDDDPENPQNWPKRKKWYIGV